jgi:non-specific serine/threonine protein kinase
VLPAITQGLGLQEDPDRPVLARLVSYLSQRDLLLLLDNFEHVLSAGAQLADLLASVPELKLVVTRFGPLSADVRKLKGRTSLQTAREDAHAKTTTQEDLIGDRAITTPALRRN